MLEQCRTAADDAANILHRLQNLTVYRTESYMLQTDADPNSSESCRIVKIGESESITEAAGSASDL